MPVSKQIEVISNLNQDFYFASMVRQSTEKASSIVANSIIEFKYIVLSNVTKEAVQIKMFITKLGIVPSITDPIKLHYDNIVIAQAKKSWSY